MKKNTRTGLLKCAALACLLGLAGCASTPVVTLNTAGPVTAEARHPSTGSTQGWLQVYSSTSEFSDGSQMYYPHTRYAIHRDNGALYKWVRNHKTPGDETPQLVALPAGTYYVLAQSELHGAVKVPVIIEAGRTTVVNLERGGAGLHAALGS